MELVPSKFFVTQSSGISMVSDLNAFDKALISAGIGEQNLVSVSSVIPIGAERIDICEMPMGAVTHCVLAQMRGCEGETIAAGIGISETIIGFTVIALGTSLPELVTTLTAIRKKENSLSVGNIIGANIIDTTLILPLCAVINGKPLPVDRVNLIFDFPVCITACAIAVVPTVIQGKFKKWQGYLLLAVYAVYMLMLILNEVGVIALG